MLDKEFEEKILYSKDAFCLSTSDARSALSMEVAPKCMLDYLQSIIDLNTISLLDYSNFFFVESFPVECYLIVERIELTMLRGAS